MRLFRLAFLILCLIASDAYAQYSAQPNGTISPNALPYKFTASTTQLSATSNTTLATVTGLSIPLLAAQTYSCFGHLTGTAGASGGLKVALVASGGLTATSITATAHDWNGLTQNTNTTVSALASNIVASTAIYTDVDFTAEIVVNAAGTINVQAAQNVSNATATTVNVGSTFACVQVTA